MHPLMYWAYFERTGNSWKHVSDLTFHIPRKAWLCNPFTLIHRWQLLITAPIIFYWIDPLEGNCLTQRATSSISIGKVIWAAPPFPFYTPFSTLSWLVALKQRPLDTKLKHNISPQHPALSTPTITEHVARECIKGIHKSSRLKTVWSVTVFQMCNLLQDIYSIAVWRMK